MGRLRARGVEAHFPFDPRTQDATTVATLASLFDETLDPAGTDRVPLQESEQ